MKMKPKKTYRFIGMTETILYRKVTLCLWKSMQELGG